MIDATRVDKRLVMLMISCGGVTRSIPFHISFGSTFISAAEQKE